jgi:AraC-like DNA-binding protein
VLWNCALEGLHRELETAIDPQHLMAWTDAVRLLSQRVLHGRTDRLSSLWQHVEANLAHPWTVSELASWAGMSEVHLRRLTHAKWQHSPMQHVSWLRIRRAEYLFSLPGQTVEMVASIVGYQSPSSFTVAFKRWLGRSPKSSSTASVKSLE